MNTKRSLGAMLDCSRDAVYTTETLKEFFALLSEMGYTNVQLYTEDTFEVEGEPYFGYLRGRYSKSELKELDHFASENGLELIPCIQTLAHLGGITRWSEYRPCTDFDDILLIGEERTYTLIENMFKTCAECFTSRRINIGMDEAHMVGLGKYLDKHGFKNRLTLLSEHLRRVLSIAKKYGFRPMMWSDMFFRLVNGGTYGMGGEICFPNMQRRSCRRVSTLSIGITTARTRRIIGRCSPRIKNSTERSCLRAASGVGADSSPIMIWRFK